MSTSNTTVVLITGANSGVGFAGCEVITQASSNFHVLLASRNLENGQKAADELQGNRNISGKVSAIQLDVTDTKSIQAAAEKVGKEFGRLDVLVNNAGIASQEKELQKALEINFKTNAIGPALVTDAFKPLLLKSTHPYSIYVSSGLGSLGLAEDPNGAGSNLDFVTYRMSKSALNMWAVQEAKVLGKQGVKTFVMDPGFVVSNLRGKSEEARQGGSIAQAEDPRVAGQLMLDIIEGRRDSEVGKFVNVGGQWPW